jgi:hypothetical protein
MTIFYFLPNKPELDAGVESVYFQIVCEHVAVNAGVQRGREEYDIMCFVISGVRFIACHVSCYV